MNTWSDAAILAALQSAAGDGPLSVSAYDAFRGGRDLPSSARVIQRYGSWSAACSAAGLEVNAGRASYATKWTLDALAESVADYLATEGSTGAYAGYAAWAAATTGAPSAQTVRNRFGGWAAAKAAGVAAMAARG